MYSLTLLLAACGPDGADTSGDSYVPEGPSLVINEFLAKSEAGYADEADEFDNWLEIYSKEDAIVQYDGLYLTDDEEDPTKWALPSGDGIDAGGFALFWADGDVDQGDNHMSFKLSGAGEYLALYYVESGYDPVPLDRLEYTEQALDQSMARVPDGSDDWQADTTPSPGETNGG